MNKMFPTRLKQLRLEKGITQEEMAEKLNVRRSTYGEYERGKIMPPIDKIESIAKLLHTTPQYLLNWRGSDREDTIGHTLKNLRLKQHKSEEEFANEIGISVSSLRSYEDNIEPVPINMLSVFAEYLGVPVEALISINAINTAGTIYFAKDPILVEQYRRWYSEVGDIVFSLDEIDKIIHYAKYVLYLRGEDKNGEKN